MKFRPVRGGLETSMKELKEWNNIDELMLAILDTNTSLKYVTEAKVRVEPYAPWTWPDKRINWAQTYLVTVEPFGPVGFADGPIPGKAPEFLALAWMDQ